MIVAPDGHLLARIDREGIPSAGHLALPIANRNRRDLGIGIGIDAVIAWTKHRERHVGCVDLEDLILPEIAHADRERPFGKPDLHRLVIQIQKLKRSIGTQTQSRRPDV